jgi:protein gp37
MGEHTGIAWTDSTFNIAWGCLRVSDACKFCYADTWAKRMGLDLWKPGGERRTFGAKHWNQPLKWQRQAERDGKVHRVFCSSMCDVFEDHPTLAIERVKLWSLIEATPLLTWQLLTKRPENMLEFTPSTWRRAWPRNVWAMTTAENGEELARRVPYLADVPAVVRGLSIEPMLGCAPAHQLRCVLPTLKAGWDGEHDAAVWVVTGGESGPHARPFDLAGVLAIRDVCAELGATWFHKQHGELWAKANRRPLEKRHPHGADPAEWAPEFRVQRFPQAAP